MSDEPTTNAAPPTPPTDEPKPEHPVAAGAPVHEPVDAEFVPEAAPPASHDAATVHEPAAMGVPESEHAHEEASGAEPPTSELPEPTEATSHETRSEAPIGTLEPPAEEVAPESEPAVTEQTAEPTTESQPTEPQPRETPVKPKRTRKKAASTTPETSPATVAAVPATPATTEAATENKKKWYAIKVQSGREESIKAAIMRKVAIEGLEEFLGRIEIPVEEEVVKKTVRVKDKKTGEYTTQEKKVTKKKKKFHGYIFAELEFNDRILYLFRETSGVGDFLNMRGKPPVPEPMPDHEVQAMLTGVVVKDRGGKKPVKIKLDFEKGDRVRIRDGSFANQEGEVKLITEPKDPTESPKVTVELTFWGRPLAVEDLEYWQVEKV